MSDLHLRLQGSSPFSGADRLVHRTALDYELRQGGVCRVPWSPVPGPLRASGGLHQGTHETAGQGKHDPACAKALSLRGAGCAWRASAGSDGTSWAWVQMRLGR